MKNMKEYVENMKKQYGGTKRDSVSYPPSPLIRDVSVTRTLTRFLGWPPVPKGKAGLPPKTPPLKPCAKFANPLPPQKKTAYLRISEMKA